MLAQTAADWINLLDKFGVPLVLLVLVIMGKIVPGFLHDRLWQENCELKDKIHNSGEAMQEKVIPAIVEANRLLTEVATMLRDRR